MQDSSDGSYELPSGRTSRSSSNNGSTGGSARDLLSGGQTDAHASDKYTNSSRRSRTSGTKKERRKSKRTSGSASSSSISHNNTNKSSSNHSSSKYVSNGASKSKLQYTDSTSTSTTNYADSRYVLPPKVVDLLDDADTGSSPKSVTRTTNDEINALLNSASVADRDDPLAGYNGDEFEDEMDDIEMVELREEKLRNFDRFGDTEVSSMQKFARHLRLYCIPLLMGLLFLLGIVAGILYLVGVGKNANNSNQSASKFLQAVPVAPATLALMCETTTLDGTSINTFQVPELCYAACKKAECCWAPDGPYKCTSDTLDQCAPYDECLQHGETLATPPSAATGSQMTVPTFPAGLQDLCSATSSQEISSTGTTCGEGCAAASCCWDKQTSVLCSEDSVHNCGNYKEVCNFLNLAPSVMNDKTWPFPDAPQGLSVYCEPSEMEEISLHICQDRCAAAECCWKTDVDSCLSTYPDEACRDYTNSCDILNQLQTASGGTHDTTTDTAPPAAAASTTSNVPAAPSDLGEICDNAKITDTQSGGEALIECEQDCLKASCCWQPNVDVPCKDDDICKEYVEPCSVFAMLFEKPADYDPASDTLAPLITTQVPEAVSTIGLTCNADVLKTSVDNGKFIVECEKECLKGACCWKENHPTVCPDAAECAAYMEPCGGNLLDALLAMEGGTTSSTPPPVTAPTPPPTTAPVTMAPLIQSNVPDAADNINMICNEDVLKLSVSNGEFIVSCEKECLEGACCWKENHSTICPDASQCSGFQACKDHLVPALEEIEGVSHNLDLVSNSESNTPPAPPLRLTDVCAADNIVDMQGLEECRQLCAVAGCCFDNGSTSCSTNAYCGAYQTECAQMRTMLNLAGSTRQRMLRQR